MDKKIGITEAKAKIEYYCNYRERCQKEVKEKLYSYGLNTDEVNELLVYLIRVKLLNEQRFAIAYAGSKFRQKKWGRSRIVRELKNRQISERCIAEALKEIEDDDYSETIRNTAEKYYSKLKTGTEFERRQKTLKYMLGRGFEYDQCHKVLSELKL